jgi:hypothetical protein
VCTHPSDTLSHASPLLSSRRTAETLARGKTSSPTTERIVRFRFGLFGNVPPFSRIRPPRPRYRFSAPRSLILRWHRACAPPPGGTKPTKSACTASAPSSARTATVTLAAKKAVAPCLSTRGGCTSGGGTAATTAPYATVSTPLQLPCLAPPPPKIKSL